MTAPCKGNFNSAQGITQGKVEHHNYAPCKGN